MARAIAIFAFADEQEHERDERDTRQSEQTRADHRGDAPAGDLQHGAGDGGQQANTGQDPPGCAESAD